MSHVLRNHPNLEDPDEVYQELLDAHSELSDEESQRFNARLILILVNHIGDRKIISEALRVAARDTVSPAR